LRLLIIFNIIVVNILFIITLNINIIQLLLRLLIIFNIIVVNILFIITLNINIIQLLLRLLIIFVIVIINNFINNIIITLNINTI